MLFYRQQTEISHQRSKGYYRTRRQFSLVATALLTSLLLSSCKSDGDEPVVTKAPAASAENMRYLPAKVKEINDGACRKGQKYQQRYLHEPTKMLPAQAGDGTAINTQLVVRIRERCVPVWVPDPNDAKKSKWEMQTLNLRTYGFPKDPNVPITEQDADDPNSDKIAWSAPGPTIIMHPASVPGGNDGTNFNMRLFNRMPYDPTPHACNVLEKCDTDGKNAGFTPSGQCKQPVGETKKSGGFKPGVPFQSITDEKGKKHIVEPPNCFHGNNSTNFHFHGFHVSPQENLNADKEIISYQDNVFLELRPPIPQGVVPDRHNHHSHGDFGSIKFGHADFDLDPLRYTQPPGTHWYHAHKHGSTALQVLNGLVGTFEVRGEFDEQLQKHYNYKLKDRLMVIQQLQEQVTGMRGADQTGAVLINGQADPIVTMAPGEIQRWRFVGATMQASALLNIGFPDTLHKDKPEVRQIAMDGVQFSPENYFCQPILNKPNCKPQENKTEFEEFSDFKLAPGNRVDLLVKAPTKPGLYCMVQRVTSKLKERVSDTIRTRNKVFIDRHWKRCNLKKQANPGVPAFGPLLTIEVKGKLPKGAVTGFPNNGAENCNRNNVENCLPNIAQNSEFPKSPTYLADIKPEDIPDSKRKNMYYQMYQQTNLHDVQFWISQTKFNSKCFNETLTLNKPEEWTIYNNSFGVAHPFHIHQNPFQLFNEAGRGEYEFPVWRDTLALPTVETCKTETVGKKKICVLGSNTKGNPCVCPEDPGKQSDGNAFAPDTPHYTPAQYTNVYKKSQYNPDQTIKPWGYAQIRYVAKEFTGPFVNHCHILGHEDRGMMHATQAVCDNDGGDWARTGPVVNPATCDKEGFCESDCQRNKGTQINKGEPYYFPAAPQCPAPPPQGSGWMKAYQPYTTTTSGNQTGTLK